MKKNILLLFILFSLLPFSNYSSEAKYYEKLFPADAVINITLPPYGAKPDDGIDDTKIIQKAITDNVGTGRTVYFPAGTYEISDTLATKNKKGHWCPEIILQGQHREKTIFKLKDNCPEFTDNAKPKAVIMTGSMWQKGDAENGGGNKAFRNNIFDLTIDTGSGNPGAVGIDHAISNIGSIKNVTIKSGDGNGVAGISMLRKIPGPGLIKNVEISGFKVGFDYTDCQYGMTLENVSLNNQKQFGIRLGNNLLHIRKLTSINKVPAITVTKSTGVLTVIDSNLTGGSNKNPAIICDGNMLLENITISDYNQKSIRFHGKGLEEISPISRLALPKILGSTNANPLKMDIKETPEYWNANLAEWISVGPREKGEKDDTQAIQRALDSGKSTIYFVNNRIYFLSDSLVVRGNVKHVLGMGSEINLGAAKEPFSNIKNPRPLIRIEETNGEQVIFENMFFNAQYPGEVIFENNSPKDVVIKHSFGWIGNHGHRHSYRNTTKATGKLFLEDIFMPGWQFKNQQVWARQLNPELNDGDGTYPQVENIGGKLWVLGFKTEGPAPFIATSSGGMTKLLGAYHYISATDLPVVPAKSIPYLIDNSTAELSFTTENFRGNDYNVYIREIDGKEKTDLSGKNLYPRNGKKGDRSFVVPLYRSNNGQ